MQEICRTVLNKYRKVLIITDSEDAEIAQHARYLTQSRKEHREAQSFSVFSL